MDGKQQTSQTEKNCKDEQNLQGKSDFQESNGCSKCCCKNRSYVVQVSILQELPSNQRKWHERLEIVKVIALLLLFMFWETLALIGAVSIEHENIYMSAFYTVANFSFVAVAGWYFCKHLCEKYLI